MNITTNNKPRPLLALYELPLKVQNDFDYVLPDDGCPRFVKYKGEWYDCFDMMRCPGAEAPADTREAFAGWDGYASDSFFSGVVVRFVGDDEVIVGRYYS